ncbi:MAG TPA: tol-pal system protein YbgF [Candidatus Deferrimicrobiaceae bacterium]
MRRRIPGLVLLLGGVATAMGCTLADTGSFERLQNEMVAMKKDMAALKASQQRATSTAAAEGAGSGEIQTLRKNFADMNNDFDRVKSDLLGATSRMDEARVEMQRITSRQNELERSVQEMRGNADRIKELEKRMAQEEKLAKSGAAPTAATGESGPEWKSPEEMYEYGVGQVKGGNPRKGRETLTAFIAKYPNHKLLANALYWKGEAFYAEKDYENAILAFQDVVDRYPSGEKAPDAMYKQGLAFLSLNDKKNARVLLELVSSKYPRSKAAELAKKKLSEIH